MLSDFEREDLEYIVKKEILKYTLCENDSILCPEEGMELYTDRKGYLLVLKGTRKTGYETLEINVNWNGNYKIFGLSKGMRSRILGELEKTIVSSLYNAITHSLVYLDIVTNVQMQQQR